MDEHQRRKGHLQDLLGESPGFQSTGSEAVDEHVASGDQLPEHGPARRLLEVQDDRLLVAAVDCPVKALAVDHRPELTENVAASGPFNLDDLGAELAQQRADEGSGDELSQLENLEPRKRWPGHASLPAISNASPVSVRSGVPQRAATAIIVPVPGATPPPSVGAWTLIAVRPARSGIACRASPPGRR